MNDGIIFEDVVLLAVPQDQETHDSMLNYFNNNSIPICIEKPDGTGETLLGFTVAGRCKIENGFMVGSVVSDVADFHKKYEYYSVGYMVETSRYIIMFTEKEIGNEGS